MTSYPLTRDRLFKRFSYIAYNHFILLALNSLVPVLIYLFGYHMVAPQADVMTNPIIISIETNDRYAIHTASRPEQLFTLAGVRSYCLEQIQNKHPKHVSVWLKSNPTITYGKVLNLIKWLNTKGITKVSLVTEDGTQLE